jgi:hypothetical protein
MAEAAFKGASGKLYRFHALRPGAPLLAEPAVYAFARPGPGLKGWTPVFLSRTANLAERVERHERWAEARRLGATHVLALFEPERAGREAAELDLLVALRPCLNGPVAAEPLEGESAEIVAFPSAGVTFDPPIAIPQLAQRIA